MHQVVVDSLEEYLAGDALPEQKRAIDSHLKTCEECRRELLVFEETSSLFTSLKAPEGVEPSPAFYAGILQRIDGVRDTQQKASLWSLFSFDPNFGRRVVFASLLTLAVLGGYLVSRESQFGGTPPTPESVMALEQQHPDPVDRDRDMMLVTLANYQQ
jgi:anti-sigma factor RsiW